MKKFLIFLIFVFILVTSCSKDYYLKRDINIVARELLKIKESDQVIRDHDDYVDYYFGLDNLSHKLDSLTWTNDNSSIDSLISRNLFNQNGYKEFNKIKKKDYLARKNSTLITINYIDSLNALALIRLTNKYGFPSHQRLIDLLGENFDKDVTSSPQLIFVHVPELFFPRVRKLVIKEYLRGRMDKNACSQIFWHLNGRIGNPFPVDYNHCKVDTLR